MHLNNMTFGTEEQAEEMRHILDITIKQIGFDNATFGIMRSAATIPHISSTLPDEWVGMYFEKELYKVDPAGHIAVFADGPVDWKILRKFDKVRLFETYELHGHGNQGLTVPYHGNKGDFSTLGLSKHCTDSKWRFHIKKIYPELTSVAQNLHHHAWRIYDFEGMPSHEPLSTKEIRVLQALAGGLTIKEAADILCCSDRTIEKHLAKSRAKLRARTTAQTFVRATALNIIGPV